MRPNRIHNTSSVTGMLQTLNWSTLEKRHHLRLQNHTPACRNIPTNLLTRSKPRTRQYPHSYSYRLLQTTKYSYKYSFSNMFLHGCEFDVSFVEFTFSSCQTVSTVLSYSKNSISGVMVSVLASSVIYREYKPRSDQSKDYNIGICCFSAKHAALQRKSRLVGSESR